MYTAKTQDGHEFHAHDRRKLRQILRKVGLSIKDPGITITFDGQPAPHVQKTTSSPSNQPGGIKPREDILALTTYRREILEDGSLADGKTLLHGGTKFAIERHPDYEAVLTILSGPHQGKKFASRG